MYESESKFQHRDVEKSKQQVISKILQNEYKENSEKEIDMVRLAFERFNEYGFSIWPQQMRIYSNLFDRLIGCEILEAGCGIGTGTAILSLKNKIIGTDRFQRHIDFAKSIYPFSKFDLWDITLYPYDKKFDIVLAIEVLEHILDYKSAIKNLVASSKRVVYISTPNRNSLTAGTERPYNVFHVREHFPWELKKELEKYVPIVEIMDWDTFSILPEDTKITPLIYRLTKVEI